MATHTDLGVVGSVWRYPVKSMMGEEVNAAEINALGLRGDRAYALRDREDGKVATAKNPRKWPRLFDFRAAFVGPAQSGARSSPVLITLPDGRTVTSAQDDCNRILSGALARDVVLEAVDEEVRQASAVAETMTAEEYWPDMDGLDFRDTVTDFTLPAGTFFDCAVVHLLTTATLGRLGELHPQGRFDVRRFRPNIVVQPAAGGNGFLENGWINRTLAVGDQVLLSITGPCGRCVMTTLPQGDLPRDPDILRTAARHNHVQVGVYASVLRDGIVRRGDPVRLTG